MPLLDEQITALIDAAVTKAVEDTTVKLNAKFEEANKGLLANRDALLAEKKALEKKAKAENEKYKDMSFEEAKALPGDEYKKFLDAKYPTNHDSPEMKGAARLLNARSDADIGKSSEVVIRKGCSHSEYKDAKAKAKKLGVPLRITDRELTPTLIGSDGSPFKARNTDDRLFEEGDGQ